MNVELSSKTEGHRPEKVLPDISHEEMASVKGPLNQVGMDAVEMPIRIQSSEGSLLLPANVDVKVSLDKAEAKGIHMSRLYKVISKSLTQTTSELCTDYRMQVNSIKEVLNELISSQQGLSENAFFRVSFDLPVERKALISDEMGWRQYPVFVEAQKVKGQFEISLGSQVTYSSTCPCSAALSRQLVKEKFAKDFKDLSEVSVSTVVDWLDQKSSIVATPHAQRSVADFKVVLGKESLTPSFIELIDLVEGALGTPVQAAVKRQDEQEFARLNASELMFCEDAARKLKSVFEGDHRFSDYAIRVEHQESLHSHNAVSVVTGSQ